jgi:hypothetical protein
MPLADLRERCRIERQRTSAAEPSVIVELDEDAVSWWWTNSFAARLKQAASPGARRNCRFTSLLNSNRALWRG